MPVRRNRDDDWADDDWAEGESSWDDDDDDDYATPCPYCKRPIHEDAQRCPYCERYLSEEDAPVARKPWGSSPERQSVLYVVYRWVAG